MSNLVRNLKNIWANGLKRSAMQVQSMNDIKSGRLVGTDAFGNSFYESNEELSGRTRWVEYKNFWRPDLSQVEPGWHLWLGYGIDVPPTLLEPDEKSKLCFSPTFKPNLSFTNGAYVPYNTAIPKCQTWHPQVRERERERV